MLRALLILFICLLCVDVNATQNTVKTKLERPHQVTQKKVAVKNTAKKYTAKTYATTGNEMNSATAKKATDTTPRVAATGTNIGNTTYDLQTNSGMCRRVAVGPDGSVHAAWTRSTTFDIAAPDRGSGYNSSADNGDTWGDAPTARVESVRVGWPNIGVTESGRVFSITHTGGEGMNFAYKDPGGDWTDIGVGANTGDIDGVWPRVGNDGKAIHAVISRQSSFAGMENGVAYFRSFDEGDTWEGPIELPNMAENLISITVDGYFVDVQGDNVAIVFGGYAVPVVVYKSTDAGDTWDVIEVSNIGDYRNGTTPTGEGDELRPTALSSGGSSVLIDNNGKIHVWYDRITNFKAGDAADGPFFIPDLAGVMYWNEDMSAPTLIGGSVRQDYDGDKSVIFPDEADVQLYSNTTVNQISSGIDDDNNLYIAYSTTRDGAVDPSNAANYYRDIVLMKSTDGGATWQGPHNVTDDPAAENAYPSMARRVDGSVHLVFQEDGLAGTAVQNGHADNYVDNAINYLKVSVDDIVTPDPYNDTEPLLYDFVFGLVSVAVNQDCSPNNEYVDAYSIDFPDGELSKDLDVGGTFDLSMPGSIGEWVITATDSDGNSVQSDQLVSVDGEVITVEVLADSFPAIIVPNPYFIEGANDLEGWYTIPEAEIFLLPGADSVEVLVDSEYVDAGADVIDDGDVFGGCPATLTTTNSVDTSTPGVYEVTYNAVDNAGNESDPVVRIVTVISEDTTAPTLALATQSGALVMDGDSVQVPLQQGGTWEGLEVAAFDNIDGDISDQVRVDGTVNVEVTGVYEVTYTAEDNAGLSTSATIYVDVRDTQAPLLTLIGPGTIILPCQAPFAEPGVTAFDNSDGDITASVTVTGEVCNTFAGTYTLTYEACDMAGNCETATRNVVVLAPCDIDDCAGTSAGSPPTIDASAITTDCDNPEIPDSGFFTASDDEDGDLTASVTVDASNVDLGTSGIQTLTLTVTDADGNTTSVDVDIDVACAVGIEDAQLAQAISLYPNPTKDMVNVAISLENAQEVTINIYTLVGQVVGTYAMNVSGSNVLPIDLGSQAAGVYFVAITTEEGSITRKVVVE